MVRSILYATDLGLYAPYVLQHALSMSRACKAELYVIHAVEPMGLFAESVLQTYLDEKTLREFRESGLETVMASIEQRVMEGFRDELSDTQHDASMISHIRVVRGDPAQVILDQSHSLAVDLVIIGSHSHGDTQDTPLGRTASRVLQLSEIPVYLVPMLQHRGK